METKAEVLKYMFTRIQEMLPVNVVKAKKNKDYFTYIVENDCSIEFYFQTTQGGYAGKNTFCMGVSAKIKNPYFINGKTNCSTFTKHFVPNLILLTQNKMCILLRWFHLFTSFVYLCISLA